MDLDGSGELDFEEFSCLMAKSHSAEQSSSKDEMDATLRTMQELLDIRPHMRSKAHAEMLAAAMHRLGFLMPAGLAGEVLVEMMRCGVRLGARCHKSVESNCEVGLSSWLKSHRLLCSRERWRLFIMWIVLHCIGRMKHWTMHSCCLKARYCVFAQVP